LSPLRKLGMTKKKTERRTKKEKIYTPPFVWKKGERSGIEFKSSKGEARGGSLVLARGRSGKKGSGKHERGKVRRGLTYKGMSGGGKLSKA